MAEPELPFPLPPDRWEAIAAQLKFSPKQKDVVELILRNRCYKQIETAMKMSHPTLRTHLNRIFHKSRVGDRQELILALCAMSHGMRHP